MKVIITGSTGMVGKGVLIECLEHPSVSDVLVLNRSPLGMTHPKLKEVLHPDFSNLSSIASSLIGYDACFYCMGISSIGKSEEEFTKITYDTTFELATILHSHHPDMVFNYVSGQGTDSSEKGKIMWARVKGRTENMIFEMGFKDSYAFRPNVIIPEKGIKSKTPWYNAVYVIARPFFGIIKKLNSVTTSAKLGRAMIHSVLYPQDLKKLENPDINHLADQAS